MGPGAAGPREGSGNGFRGGGQGVEGQGVSVGLPAAEGQARGREGGAVRVWDPVVRLSHWSAAGLFATCFLSANYGRGWLHELAGYGLLGVVLLRGVWGLVGPEPARFRAFLRPPWEVWRFLRDHLAGRPTGRWLGHNPAGGAMAATLLGMELLLGLTGLATLATVDFWGPLWPWLLWVSDAGAQALRELHEALAWTALGLVGLHLAGVAYTSWREGENLVVAMITGRKAAAPARSAD